MSNNDFIGTGFHKIDSKYVSTKAPKIAWGILFLAWSDRKKVVYLQKFASSMNHAAFLLQEERSELNRLCILKEQQIVKLNNAMMNNNAMLQSEVTKINAERQSFNAEAVKLNRQIRELSNDHIG